MDSVYELSHELKRLLQVCIYCLEISGENDGVDGHTKDLLVNQHILHIKTSLNTSHSTTTIPTNLRVDQSRLLGGNNIFARTIYHS